MKYVLLTLLVLVSVSCQSVAVKPCEKGVVINSVSDTSIEISVEDFNKWKEFEVIQVNGVDFSIDLNDGATSLMLSQVGNKNISGKFVVGKPVTVCHKE
jgi:hypothetical protein